MSDQENSGPDDFVAAVKKGIAAFRDCNRVRAEVGAVLALLSAQIYEASDRKIVVSIEPRTQGGADAPASLIEAAALREGRTFTIAASARSKPRDKRELAVLRLSERGYPLTLSFDRHEESCVGRDGVVSGLKCLLEYHETGAVFNAIWPEAAK